jgi:hypothetical protein
VPELDDERSNTQRYTAVRVSKTGVVRPPLECRAVFFRAAYLLFGSERGTHWLLKVREGEPRLAELLRLGMPVTGWQDAANLTILLKRAGELDLAGPDRGRTLGQTALSAGWGPLVTSGGPIDPARLVEGVEPLFARYWRGARATVEGLGHDQCQMTVSPGLGDRLTCSIVEGWFMRLVELSGGNSVLVEHTEHSADGEGACRFQLRWTPLAVG